MVRDFFNRSAKGVTRVNGNSNEKTKADATDSTGVWWAMPTSCEVVSWATAADCVGKYMWRTKGRTIEFDFHEGGTFEAEEKPDGVALSEGMGLVSKGKGIWMVLNGRLSVARTHVWMFMYWQKNPVTWINDVKVVSVTRNGIRLESGNPLQRI